MKSPSFEITSSLLMELWRHKIIRHDVKIWGRHISVENVGIALKLCRLFDFDVAIICINFWEFSQSRLWFTEILSFTDVLYLWLHWRLPMAYYKQHGFKNYLYAKRERLISLPVKFQVHIISRSTFLTGQKGGGTTPINT